MRTMRYQCARTLPLLFALAGVAAAQVNLTSPAAPVIVGANIQIAGTGYPSGTISGAQTNVTITPSAGNGAPVSFCLSSACGGPLGSNVTPPTGGSARTLIFKLPNSLLANAPYTATVSVSGQTTAATAFSTATTASITINPQGSISNVSPGAGQLNTVVNNVMITGSFTHFGQLTSVVTTGCPGVNVTNMQVMPGSLTQLTATFNIPNNATPGACPVTVTTGSEVATIPVGFVVTTSSALPFSVINPNSGAQGTVGLMVDVQGTGTHFAQGTTTANFGDGVTITNIKVNTLTDMTVTLSIDPLARTGSRMVTVVTGGEFAAASGGFTVTSSGASIVTCLPANPLAQGTNATLQLTGVGTHWVTSGTVVSFGGGINTGSITVNSNTSLTVNISVGPGVPAGSYGVTTTTNGEVATLSNAVTVTAATPFISGVLPTTGAQGTNVPVVVTGTFTNFTLGTLSANFGSHITVNSFTAVTATSVTINISIDNVAATGGRSVTLTTNGTLFSFNFTVNPSGALLTGVNPNNGLQQSSVALQVQGLGTHWVQGTTMASLGDIYITINRVIVNSATTAEVDITIGATASLGLRTVTMSTGGEVVSLPNSFTVLPFTPSLSISPSSGMVGTLVNVNLNGNFTHFSNQTELNIDGAGIQIQNFMVSGTSTAVAQFVISATAPSSPAFPCTPGNRTVTMTTGTEIVTAPFCVTSTPAVLTSITPNNSPVNVNNLSVTITGQFTHFTTGGATPTTVSFGPNITVNGPLTGVTSTSLTANISITGAAALGWRQAFVSTGSEQLSIGFLIDSPASATLVSVSPNNGQQGQSINNVTITGNLTNFVQGNTIAILGAGVTVSNLQIVSHQVATATVSISPTTYTGGRTVEMITGPEDVSGPQFSVTPGIATISFTPNCNPPSNYVAIAVTCSPTLATVQQGGIVPFNITGSSTHFLQGETTLYFGPGIVVTQLTVNSPTSITGQIAVSYTAPIGFTLVTATTDGEVAPDNSDALNVIQTTSTSLNITPTSGLQGTQHLQIQLNGQLTNWINGNTSATFGNNNGLVVNSVTVSSATQAVLDLTIQGTTYVGLYTLTVNTIHNGNPEQEILNNYFSVGPGAAIITNVTPTAGGQGSSANVQITGQNTSWINGVTTAFFTTGSCTSSPNPGVNSGLPTVTSTTAATLSIAISPTAQTGLQTLCMATLGELVSYANAFTISPGTPTLNGVTPVMAEQGQALNNVAIIGQFTHWVQGTTTVTFGQGITLTAPLVINNATSATANIAVDPLAYTGSRNVVLNTPLAAGGSEIVQGTAFFTVTPGPAILSSINPSTGNQGQHILMLVTGENTHWAQGLSQVTINGSGYDITINGVQVQSPTTLELDFNISPTANLGLRTIYVSTGGENVTLNNGFVVTGGIPSISGISPSSVTQGATGVNVQISGIFTAWTQGATNVSFGPNITFGNPAVTVENNGSLTAIINVPNNAPLGLTQVTVQTGAQILTTYINVLSNAPPTPYISYEYPSVALVGQTLSVSLAGAYTHWLPGTTGITFGAGIVVNTFQVTGLTTAIANITIVGAATTGTRTVIMTTGAEVEQTSFTVTVGTPTITLVSPTSIIQGQTLDVDVVGQYTTFNNTTVFNFGQGITNNLITIFGPTAARINVTANILANLGGRSISETTGSEVAYGGFSVTPSLATITSVMPNTAPQGTAPVIQVTGFATHWTNATQFNMGGIGITNVANVTATTAQLTLSIPALATIGFYNISATTGGEYAYLNNAFVVTPGTPILVSATGNSVQQGMNFSTQVIGQLTNFNGTTTVDLGTGVFVTNVNVTSPTTLTVTGNADPLSYTGSRNITVTTGAQQLILFGDFQVTPGTAQITLLNPNQGSQGQTNLMVAITGTNTHFNASTQCSFGPGIACSGLQVNTLTTATATITISANATPEINTVTLTTLGETASDNSAFTIVSSTPIIDFINPTSLVQGQTGQNIQLTGSFTHWVNGNTVASFGPAGSGINVTNTVIPNPGVEIGNATVTVTPVTPIGKYVATMTTNLGGGLQEIATESNALTITASGATISTIVPFTTQGPGTLVRQNDVGDVVVITGTGTHFNYLLPTLPTVTFCNGVSTTAVVVNGPTSLNVTINVGQLAPVGACGVTVTTGGEIATSGGTFNVNAGTPVLTSVNPTSALQGQTLNVTINGLYTKFTHTPTTFTIPGATLNGSLTLVNDQQMYGSYTFSPTATTGLESVSTNDAVDGAMNLNNSFTVNPGVPALISVAPPTLGQGLTANIVLTGAFTHFNPATSVVTVSGTGVTVGGIISATATAITIPFTVTAGAAATARTVQVQTPVGAITETVQLGGGFTVLPGTPSITQVNPNIAVPSSSGTVTFYGIFTNWLQGTTMAKIGNAASGVHINGGAAGATVVITVDSLVQAHATVSVDAGAPIQANDLHIYTGIQDLPLPGGFQVLANSTTPPVVTFITPTSGAVNVPTNTGVSITFSEPLNPATVSAATAFITDTTVASCWANHSSAIATVPGTPMLDATGRVLTITPLNPLGVGRTFQVQLDSSGDPTAVATPITDQSGNALGHYCYSFTAGLAPNLSGPAFITSSIPSGATGVPTNTPNVQLQFNQPINPATQAAGLSITTGAVPVAVPGLWSWSNDQTQAYFTPTGGFAASTTYTVNYTNALQNSSGIALTNQNTFQFTTSSGGDTISGAYVTWTPPQGTAGTPTTGTNPTIRFIYNKAINPLTVSPANFYVYDTQNGVTVLGSTLSYSADFKTWTLNLASTLLPGTNYRWILNSASDWDGNNVPYGSVYFQTGPSQDLVAPTVSSISPSATVTAAPSNTEIQIQFSKWMDPTSLTTSAITVSETAPVAGAPVAGTFSFSPDLTCTTPSSSGSCNFTRLTFKPTTPLNPSATYQVVIPDNNLADLNGNYDPFTSTFGTSATSTPDTTPGTYTITPTSGATGVPLSNTVVVQFSKQVDPLTVFFNTTASYSSSSFVVYDQTASGNVPGNVVVSPNLLTITYTPSAPFEPNHQICVYPSYWVGIYDLAGNRFPSGQSCFTTAAGTDSTPPTVTMVSPQNGATGIGANNPVIVTFSKPINSGTLSTNIAMYTGSTLYTTNYSVSGDGTTVSFNPGNMPFGTTYTIVVNPAVTDLAGNHLAAEFTSTFTTMAAPVTSQPSVTAFRPGSGATGVSPTNPISFFMSAAMKPSTITSSTLVVSQNGTVIPGNIAVTGNNQNVEWTPTAGSFAGGSYIQVFFTSGATDASGNPLTAYQSQFTVAANTVGVPPTVTSANPCYNCYSYDNNTVVEMLFSKPILLSTANTANFYISTSTSGTPIVPGNVTLLDGGRLMRFKSTSLLSSNTYYYVFATNNIQDTTGLNFTGGSSSYLYWIYTATGSNSTAPSVTSTAPFNGAGGIGTNSIVSVTFSENVDSLTLDPSNVTLTGPSGSIPLTISYSNPVMTITPQAPLPPSASITLTLNGLTDNDGDALNPTPFNNLTFVTEAVPDFNPPVFATSNITNNQSNVPVTSSVSYIFNKQIDWRSVIYLNTIYLQDATASDANIPATISPIGFNGILITPTSPLSVGHQFRVYSSGIADLNGNVAGSQQVYFNTVLVAPGGGPVITQMTPVNNTTAPVNFSPMVQFDRPISALALSGVTLSQGGSPVAATAQLSSGNTILTLVPSAILQPGTPYVFTVTGVTDASGTAMSGTVTRSFTTGPGIEITNPGITIGSPVYNSTAGINPVIEFTFSEQVNPIASGSFTFYEVNVGNFVSGSTLVWASDMKSVRVSYPGSLAPGSRYYVYLNCIYNLAGYCTGSPQEYFYTGTSADSSPETVTSVTPPAGSIPPTNPLISLVLAKPAAPYTVNNSSVTLTPAAPAGSTVSLSSDGYTLTLNLGGVLAASTPYTINVANGAFTDQDGNAVAAFSSGFTTGTSAELSSTHGTISMTGPAPGATGIPITTTITATFSAPLDPLSLNASTFVVYENNNSSYPIAGTVTNPTPNTLVFTPAVALPPNTQINAYVGYYASILDYAGNTFSSLYGCCGGTNAYFTTANTADNTPPQIISFSPGNGATNVGPYAPVSFTFNKSVDYTTASNANFSLWNGTSFVNPSISYSGDHRTVYLNSTLSYGTTYQVAVNTNVKDYAGNSMANPFTASFTTQLTPVTASPYVIQARPGNGAAITSPITMFMSAPMNLSNVQAGLSVAQNGVLINGNATLTADLRRIIWTPTISFQTGAYIEVYLTSTATDTSLNPATAYKFTFTTAAATSSTTTPTEVSVYPSRYTYTYFSNPVVDVVFSKPINPATVTSTTFAVTTGSGCCGAAIAGGFTYLNNNTVVRFTPTAGSFPAATYFFVSLTTGIQDTFGNPFAGDSYWEYIYTGSVPDNTPPTVSAVTPANGSIGIGDNAPVRLLFSKLIDTNTVNPSTVQIKNGATVLPWTASFGTYNSTQTVATLTTQAPLPDGATITVQLLAGISDLTGAAVPTQSTTFQTLSGADFTAPYVTRQSIDNDNKLNVPTNATFTFQFSKPLDPSTVNANTSGNNTNGFYIYNSNGNPTFPPVNANVSPDGMTVTIVPQANLSPSATNDYVYVYNATDLDGNVLSGTQQQFLTASGTNLTGPTIVATNPTSGSGTPTATNTTAVPTDTDIEVIFSAPVSNTSLGSVTLTGGANGPYTVYLENGAYTQDNVIRILPQQLLLPNTAYTVTVAGVKDVAGNAAAGTTFTFTTGPNYQFNATNFVSATVTTTGGTVPLPNNTTPLPNVLDSPTFVLTFDHAIDYASLLYNGINLRDVNFNLVTNVTLSYTLSADQKTVTITTSGLAAATTYRLMAEYGIVMYDIVGDALQNTAYLYFVTQ